VEAAAGRHTIRITFVRHGATDWNRDRRFQGQVDIPLNAEGRAQAQALADALRDETFDYAASSDLSRAYETAIAIRNGAAVHRDARWREFAFGEWEGLTWEQIVRRHPQLAESDRTMTERYVPPGGETFDAVCGRVGRALADYELQQSGNVLIVTHAGPLHAMLHTYFGNRAAEMQEALGVRFSPAGITRVEVVDGRAELLQLNDISHLIRAEWDPYA
jgi:2,3-bisphosphoglycerate-dependent phosphoglycerate mutase